MKDTHDQLKQISKAIQHEAEAPAKFLKAWKLGISKVGIEFFTLSCSLEQAKNKNELVPNYNFIKETINGYSRGAQALLALMYSFYDSIEGQKLLEQVKLPNFVDAIAAIDFESKKIIADLCDNYTGW